MPPSLSHSENRQRPPTGEGYSLPERMEGDFDCTARDKLWLCFDWELIKGARKWPPYIVVACLDVFGWGLRWKGQAILSKQKNSLAKSSYGTIHSSLMYLSGPPVSSEHIRQQDICVLMLPCLWHSERDYHENSEVEQLSQLVTCDEPFLHTSVPFPCKATGLGAITTTSRNWKGTIRWAGIRKGRIERWGDTPRACHNLFH